MENVSEPVPNIDEGNRRPNGKDHHAVDHGPLEGANCGA